MEQQPSERVQARILRGLVHRARHTHFGREHDFDRIRTPADFRRLVPLRSVSQLWREYGQPHFPHLEHALGAGPITHLLPATGRPGEGLPFVPVTPGLLQSHRDAILTALALTVRARPNARLLGGRVLFVGGAAAPAALNGHSPAGSLEEIVLGQLPAFWRPYFARTVVSEAGHDYVDERFRVLARESTRLPVTCLLGTGERLRQFVAQVRQLTGRERLTEVWPTLSAIIHAGHLGERTTADPLLHLDVCFRPEGTIAVEDPRHGLPRLLVDHGLYYEFVPVEEVNAAEPVRHSVAEVEPGLPYEVALTSPAGLWATRIGLVVRFESRDPPLLMPMKTPARARTSAPLSPLAPHPPGSGIPATLRETPFHNPWSARADRG